jgi:hypothetical protein
MNYKIKQIDPKLLNRLTPLENMLREITDVKLSAKELNLTTDVKVLEGVEKLIIFELENSTEEKAIIAFGMSLLTSNMAPESLNNHVLDNVFARCQHAYNEVFNAKDLFIEYIEKQKK